MVPMVALSRLMLLPPNVRTANDFLLVSWFTMLMKIRATTETTT